MNQKERLVELSDNVITSCKSSLCDDCEHNNIDYPHCMSVHFADSILADGWMRPPVKVGDVVYLITDHTGDMRRTVTGFTQDYILSYAMQIPMSEFGKTVFLTREEAEKALRKEDESNGVHI